MMHKTQVIAVCLIVAVWFCIVGVTPVVPMLENVAEAQTVQARKKYYDVSRLSVGAGTQQRPFTSWDRQMNKLSAAGKEGLTFYFPAGWYTASERVTLRRGWQIRGDGMDNTIIVDPKGQGVFYAAGPVNGSTAGHNRITDLKLLSHNLSPTASGAGIEIFGLTFVNIERVMIDGYLHNLILDQAEIVHVSGCHFLARLAKSRGLWLVNGPSRNPAALGGVTNVIHVDNCFFSGSGLDNTMIVDDGGAQHTFRDNNFSGYDLAMYVANVTAGTIESNYFESRPTGQRRGAIVFDSRYFDDVNKNAGQCGNVSVSANHFSQTPPAVRIVSAGHLTFSGNFFGGSGGPAQIIGCGNVYSLKLFNDYSPPNVPVQDRP